MRLAVYLVASLFLIGSCSAQNRINRIVQKNPGLILTDSIKVTSRIIIPERSALMSFPINRIINLKTGDTISAMVNNISLAVTRSSDSASFHIMVPADTIEKDTVVRIDRIKVTGSARKRKWKRIDWILFTIIFTGSMSLITSLIRKHRRDNN
jgi:hypothetical protein